MTTATLPTNSAWKRELAQTFALAWPLIIAQVANNAIFTTDVIMMGWLGPDALAAGTLAVTFYNPFYLMGTGIVSAVAPLAAQALGARQHRFVRRTVRQGFWAAILIAMVLFPIIWQVRPGLILLGQDPGLAAFAETYAHIAVFILFPALGIYVLRSFLSALAATRIILYVTIVGVLANIVGNYLLMFGHFGFPRLELRGAAISTLVVNVAMFSALLFYVLNHRRYRRFHILARFWRPDWMRFREIFRIGVPMGLTVLSEVGMFAVAAIFMGWLGRDELAAHAIALQCTSLAFMVPLGLSVATTVRVGLKFGAGDKKGVGIAGWTSFGAAMVFETITCTLFVTMPFVFVSLFLDPAVAENARALSLAASFLVIAGLFQLVDGAQVVSAYALRGLNDTKVPMMIALVGYWLIGVPASYYLGSPDRLGGIGIWTGLAIGLSVCAVILTTRFALRERLGLLHPDRLVQQQ